MGLPSRDPFFTSPSLRHNLHNKWNHSVERRQQQQQQQQRQQ